MRTKKEAKKDWEKHGQQEAGEHNKRCKKGVKRAVAWQSSEIYEELKTSEGEKKSYNYKVQE